MTHKDTREGVEERKREDRGGEERDGRVHILSHLQDHSKLKSCSSDFHKLLRKIQGVPATLDFCPLEMTVVYSACAFSIAQSQVSQAESLLTEGLQRALCICTLRLLCLQWAIWLSMHRLKHIQDLKEELSSLSGRLSALEDEQREKNLAPQTPRLVAEPIRLAELLDICTILTQGAEWLSDGRHSEALSELQRGFSLRAPRNLLADAHVLSGLCLANMAFPLNTSALLSSPSLRGPLSVPSPASALHSLALKCVLHGRVAEGVEHYLDLLAVLRSDHPHVVHTEAVPALPRVCELYLETATALLLVGRTADCVALCDEVLSATLDLLPERLALEDPTEDCGEGEGSGSPSWGWDHDTLDAMLWAGCAHLLQAHCQAHVKDWKLATQASPVDPAGGRGSKVCTLQRLKGLSFAGRGISFTQRDQLREALRDLQLGTQLSPECVSAGLWLGEVLWRLDRQHEAASCWEKSLASTEPPGETFPLYLQELKCNPSLDPTVLRNRVQNLTRT
ncbi:hypothetical protein CRUP_009192 [Coryphaenoides rupestris]|nr:hypothetical protein CRUP_009192 [Coryphaenoides rupestris]